MINWNDYPELGRMWRTRGSRFGAHERLTKTNIWVSYAIATGSAYVIFLSLLGILDFGVFGDDDAKIVGVFSVVISVGIIFLSLIEGGKNFVAQAEAMHNCAREITHVYHAAEAKVRAAHGSSVDLIAETKEYDQIVDRCRFNHDLLDEEYFKAINSGQFDSMNKDVIKRVSRKRWWSIYGLFIGVSCGIPFAIFVFWVLIRIFA